MASTVTSQLLQLSLCVVLLLFVLSSVSNALPTGIEKPQLPDMEDSDDTNESLRRIINELLHERRYGSDKRSLDMGFSRGFSGSQAARHLIGLAAANFAGGPGKRRRRDVAADTQQ